METYKTLKDIIIPAGTILKPAPDKIEFISQHTEAIVGFGKDYCASMYFDDDLIKSHPDTFVLCSQED